MVAAIKGTIARFEDDGTAVIQTQFGEAFLDINTGFDYRLVVGDRIMVEGADFYITDGRIFTCLGDDIWVNNTHITYSDGRPKGISGVG